MFFNTYYYGKVSMAVLAATISPTLHGFILLLVVGHIIDMHWNRLKYFFLSIIAKKTQTQKTSEKFIFLLAYCSYVLVLDPKKAAKSVVNAISTSNPDSVRDLFLYYVNVYIPKNIRQGLVFDQKIKLKIKELNLNADLQEDLMFFNIVEKMFFDQTSNVSSSDQNLLINLAKLFNINYMFKPEDVNNAGYSNSFDSSRHAGQSTQGRQSNSANNSKRSFNSKAKPSSYIPDDVKLAFKEVGFKTGVTPTMLELKAEYRKKVRKYHPDILKGQNLSGAKIQQAENKLVKLNKSMDIAKKFLANS